MAEPERRRRRLRPPTSAPETTSAPEIEPIERPLPDSAPPVPATPPGGQARWSDDRRRPGMGTGGEEREAERGLRGLVGSGSSQVSVGAALRARDAARPRDEHLAEAEENLVIVRRNWLPREELPRR